MAGTTKRPRTAQVAASAIDQAHTWLQTLPEKQKEALSLREAIEKLQEPLQTALEKGYSYEDLTELLQKQGIEISVLTLKRYLSISKRPSDKTQAALPKTRTRRKKNADSLPLDVVDSISKNGSAPAEPEPEKAPAIAVVEPPAEAEPEEAAPTKTPRRRAGSSAQSTSKSRNATAAKTKRPSAAKTTTKTTSGRGRKKSSSTSD